MDKILRFTTRGLLIAVCLWITIWGLGTPVQSVNDAGLEEKIVEAFETEAAVNLEDERITGEELNRVVLELLYGGALPWYADWYRFSYNTETGYVVEFFPQCFDKAVYDRQEYQQKVEEILDETVHDGMSQWQIALSIHDYLAANYAYDQTYTNYHGCDLLMEGTAVCSGYAEAYMDLLKRVGIPCVIVQSETMNHGWNLIQLDGSWYHVDVTWDDPIPDEPGRVSHGFFLKTDEEISSQAGGHEGWEGEVTCTDDRFQDGFWNEITGQICYLDGDSYYVRDKQDGQYVIELFEQTDKTAFEKMWLKVRRWWNKEISTT